MVAFLVWYLSILSSSSVSVCECYLCNVCMYVHMCGISILSKNAILSGLTIFDIKGMLVNVCWTVPWLIQWSRVFRQHRQLWYYVAKSRWTPVHYTCLWSQFEKSHSETMAELTVSTSPRLLIVALGCPLIGPEGASPNHEKQPHTKSTKKIVNKVSTRFFAKCHFVCKRYISFKNNSLDAKYTSMMPRLSMGPSFYFCNVVSIKWTLTT